MNNEEDGGLETRQSLELHSSTYNHVSDREWGDAGRKGKMRMGTTTTGLEILRRACVLSSRYISFFISFFYCTNCNLQTIHDMPAALPPPNTLASFLLPSPRHFGDRGKTTRDVSRRISNPPPPSTPSQPRTGHATEREGAGDEGKRDLGTKLDTSFGS